VCLANSTKYTDFQELDGISNQPSRNFGTTERFAVTVDMCKDLTIALAGLCGAHVAADAVAYPRNKHGARLPQQRRKSTPQ
jgi:hypothetical protein